MVKPTYRIKNILQQRGFYSLFLWICGVSKLDIRVTFIEFEIKNWIFCDRKLLIIHWIIEFYHFIFRNICTMTTHDTYFVIALNNSSYWFLGKWCCNAKTPLNINCPKSSLQKLISVTQSLSRNASVFGI